MLRDNSVPQSNMLKEKLQLVLVCSSDLLQLDLSSTEEAKNLLDLFSRNLQ